MLGLREAEKANIPFLAALPGALPRCSSLVWLATPDFDTSEAHFLLTPSNGAGLRAIFRQTPRYTDC